MSRYVVRSSLVAAVVAVVALMAGLFTGTASAHSALIGSSPEQGAKIATAPDKVTLTFNEDLKSAYATLKVVGPDGNFWQVGEPTVSGTEISVPLDGLGPVGQYVANYRVTSADGHPVQGQVSFELTQAGDGRPGAAADDSTQSESDDHGVKAWQFIVGGVVVVLLIAGVLALTIARRRN
ncbi:copper resistance CopC family protein [Gordonia hydrophobica]|uniref:Copper resistance protein CopC n=1 Tax=Gordonia hydrophobica TaxID=40516 RepID=A0ABZ2U3G3_9ACTN|nr:copper resistance CopC family protein [Gordonia hydrophobica]MBM7367528.1 methionine-rich copper-binding protein CopC [Gordonia hydrophobica]